jgi:predicted metalloprotease
MTPTVLPLWLEVIKAVAPLLAALLAAGVGAWVAHKFGRIQESIAKQQAATAAAAATTARNKLRLDLFDRRWAIYQTAKGVIDTMAHQDDDPDSAALKYLSNIRAAR